MRILLRFVAVVVVAGVGLAGAVAALAPQAATVFMARGSSSSIPDLGALAERSLMYAVDGSVIQSLRAEENRKQVSLDQIPAEVVTAILAVEDQDFYVHKGINGRSIVRALFANVSDGGISQGGSTITQQVVKKSILTPEQTANRKIKEWAYALRLEKELTKDQILERYLNLIYLGNGAYGVQAGAEVYYGKGVGELTLPEAAFLAALIRNPTGYDPFKFPERARERRRVALNRLVDVGAMSATEADRVHSSPIPTEARTVAEAPTERGYFEEEVVQAILDDSENRFRLGDSYEERKNALFMGGLHIETTKDPYLQRISDQAVADHLPDTGGEFAAATTTIDPATGAVRAMVGGPGFANYKFNLATQGLRQPGSSFKTFVLVAALEAGARSDDVIDGNSPCTFPRSMVGGSKDYVVSSASGGVGTLSRMTASSINCAYVRLGLIVGLDRVIETAQRMGVTSPLEPVASISLGAEEVSPLDMASAYGVLANNGVRHEPYLIERILSHDGDVIYQHNDPGRQVVDPAVAATATKVLQGVVNGGTGRRARLDGREAAGKTGSSQDNADAWFVGYTPQLVTAVWMGAPTARIPMNNLGQFNAVQGGTYPALIWNQLMTDALEASPEVDFVDAPEPNRRSPQRLYLPGAECGGRYTRTTNPDGTPGLTFSGRLPSNSGGLPGVPVSGGYSLGRCGSGPPPPPPELTTTTAAPPSTVPAPPSSDPTATTVPPSTTTTLQSGVPTTTTTPASPPSATTPTTP